MGDGSQPRQYKRSASQWKLFSRCSEQFYLERILRPKLPRRPAAWTALGNALHEAFYNWELNKREYGLGQIVRDYEKNFDSHIDTFKSMQPDWSYWMKSPRTKLVTTDIQNYRLRGIENDVPTYYDYCIGSDWEILLLDDGYPALELEFEITINGIPVVGSIDKLLWWPKERKVTVDDIKTGNLDDTDHRQLGLYAFAANATLELPQPISWGRYYYTKPQLRRPSGWIDLTRYNADYLGRCFWRLNAAISNNLFLANPGKQCDLCAVRDWCSELGHLEVARDGHR